MIQPISFRLRYIVPFKTHPCWHSTSCKYFYNRNFLSFSSERFTLLLFFLYTLVGFSCQRLTFWFFEKSRFLRFFFFWHSVVSWVVVSSFEILHVARWHRPMSQATNPHENRREKHVYFYHITFLLVETPQDVEAMRLSTLQAFYSFPTPSYTFESRKDWQLYLRCPIVTRPNS